MPAAKCHAAVHPLMAPRNAHDLFYRYALAYINFKRIYTGRKFLNLCYEKRKYIGKLCYALTTKLVRSKFSAYMAYATIVFFL